MFRCRSAARILQLTLIVSVAACVQSPVVDSGSPNDGGRSECISSADENLSAEDEANRRQYLKWIREARRLHPYPQSECQMFQVMLCESNGNAAVVGSGRYVGLFQYRPATWNASWNLYRDQDIHDARAQIFATALAWHDKLQDMWGCYKHPRR